MTVNWGSLGCGDVVARKSGPALQGVPGSALVAVMRRNGALARAFAEARGVPRCYDRADRLLADPDVNAVYIGTPFAVHAELTVAAAAAGKPVLCEKPMAASAAECDRMIAACRLAGVPLGVAYYRRCYPSIERAKALLDAGAIGRPRSLHLNDEFPPSHRLDLVHFFCGDLAELSAEAGPAGPGGDTCLLRAVSRSGMEATMRIGWCERGAPERLVLRGDEGELDVCDLKGGALVLRDRSGERREVFPPLPATHWGLVANFVAHLRDGSPLACPGEEGRKSSVALDYVSNLVPGAPPVAVDYAAPPAPNRDRGAAFGLLG